MVNALLVYPQFRDATYWSFSECMDIIDRKANMPPYGLITIAGMLPKGYSLRLVDENTATLLDSDIADADIVFASAMIVQRASLNELIARCNRLHKPIVVGGPLISTGFETITGADHYFIGEAEKTLSLFVDDLAKGTAKKAYAHVMDENKAARVRNVFGKDARIVVGPRMPLTNTALPRFDLLDIRQYANMAVQYSRGCPNQCEFCDIWTQSGTIPRLKDVSRIIAEITALYELGYKGSVFVVDDNFIGNRGVVKRDLLPTLATWQKEHDNPFRFYTEATITMADDPDLLKGMTSAGFDMVFCGIETPNEASLIEVGKRGNVDKEDTLAGLLRRVRTIQEAGIEVSSGFIIGFDNDPANIDDMMIEFIQRSNIPMAMLGLLTALPETKLYERLKKEGRLKAASSGNNTHVFELNFVPKMPEQEITRKYSRVLETIYDRNLSHYFKRCDAVMDIMGPRHTTKRSITTYEVKIFMRALRKLLPSRLGPSTTSFLLKRFVKDRTTFAEAVTYAVKGIHLAHITHSAVQTHKVDSYLTQQLNSLRLYLQSVQADCQDRINDAQGHAVVIQLKDAYKRKKRALQDAQRKFSKLDATSREKLYVHYHAFVQEVHNLYRQLENTGQQSLGMHDNA